MATAAHPRAEQRTLLATQHVREGNLVWVLVGAPRMNTWWRSFRNGAPIVLRIDGAELRGWAVALDGADHRDEVSVGLARYLAVPHGGPAEAGQARRSSAPIDVDEMASHTVMVRVELEPDAL